MTFRLPRLGKLLLLHVVVCCELGCVQSTSLPRSPHAAPEWSGPLLPQRTAEQPEHGGVSPHEQQSAAEIAAPAASGQAITLPRVIEAVVLNDPRIRAAFADVLRARAELVRQSLFDNPNMTVSQSLTPFPNHRFTPTRQGGPPQLDVGINYSLERLLFGQRRAAMHAATREVDAQLASHAAFARQRVFDAIAAFVDVLETRELARLARDEIEQLSRLESITARRVALGSVGQVELSRVHIAVIAGKRRELLARVEHENALTRLKMRLGPEYFTRDVQLVDTLDVTPRQPPAFEALYQRAIVLRPELLEQERRMLAAQAATQRERRRALPRVAIGLGFTRQFQERAIGYPNANSWGASLSSSLPIFDRNQGGIATARADLFESAATLEALKVELRADLLQALRSLSAAEEILATFDPDAMKSAESARGTIEEAYALGGRSLLELLDAQQVYRDAYREHVLARAAYMRAVHRLHAVVGEEVLR